MDLDLEVISCLPEGGVRRSGYDAALRVNETVRYEYLVDETHISGSVIPFVFLAQSR